MKYCVGIAKDILWLHVGGQRNKSSSSANRPTKLLTETRLKVVFAVHGCVESFLDRLNIEREARAGALVSHIEVAMVDDAINHAEEGVSKSRNHLTHGE